MYFEHIGPGRITIECNFICAHVTIMRRMGQICLILHLFTWNLVTMR